MPKLSVTVVAKNEAADLGAALASVAWADEIVVVDSTARTTPSRSRAGTPIASSSTTGSGYIEQKNYAASLASHDWILSLDADERVTPALADEIQATLAAEPRRTPRSASRGVTWHLGRWIRTTDWYPDYQTAPLRSARGRGGPAATCTKR